MRNLTIALVLLTLSASTTQAANKALSFKEAFYHLKEQDPRLMAEESNIAAYETRALSNKLSFLPSIDVNLERRWANQIDRAQKTDTANATATLNLFAFGRDYFNLKSGSLELKAQNGRALRVELEVEKEIYSALLGVLLALENVEIYSEIEKLKIDLLDVTTARFKRGLDPSSEMLRAQVEVANARARTESAKSDLSLAKAQLKSLSAGEIELKNGWPLSPKLRQKKMDEVAQNKFNLDQRPDYKEALNTLSAIEYQKKSVFTEYLPRLNFSVARGYTQDYFDEWETTYMLSLNFPLFSRGETLVKRDDLEALRMRSYATLTLTARSAPEQYLSQLDNLVRGHKTLEARLETLGLSTKLYQENLKLFKSGRRPLFELLLDQERMLSSKQLASLGQRDFYSAMMNVCLELGMSLGPCLFDEAK